MKLLTEDQLSFSPVVANNRMNRERNAQGINSYEKDILLNPVLFLEDKLRHQKEVRWLDICCGKARALIQTHEHFSAQGSRMFFTGIDLVGMYEAVPENSPNLELITDSFFNWNSDHSYDLITCVHGIHYLGDKLAALAKAARMLSPKGVFVANVDASSIRDKENRDLSRIVIKALNKPAVTYKHKQKMLLIEGTQELDFPLRYLGADDQAGPNYTGQEAVHSFYEVSS